MPPTKGYQNKNKKNAYYESRPNAIHKSRPDAYHESRPNTTHKRWLNQKWTSLCVPFVITGLDVQMADNSLKDIPNEQLKSFELMFHGQAITCYKKGVRYIRHNELNNT